MPTTEEALAGLAPPGLSVPDAEQSPHLASPGLYAVYATAATWEQLGLGEAPDRRPLYVGKSETSFQARDLDDHFGDGRTGRSTLRRSFAALLASQLDLTPIPRGSTHSTRRRTQRTTGSGPATMPA